MKGKVAKIITVPLKYEIGPKIITNIRRFNGPQKHINAYTQGGSSTLLERMVNSVCLDA